MPASKTSKTKSKKTTSTKSKAESTTSKKKTTKKTTSKKTASTSKKTTSKKTPSSKSNETKKSTVASASATSLNPEIMAETTTISPKEETPADTKDSLDEDTIVATNTMSIDDSEKVGEVAENKADTNTSEVKKSEPKVEESEEEDTKEADAKESSDTHETFFAPKPNMESSNIESGVASATVTKEVVEGGKQDEDEDEDVDPTKESSSPDISQTEKKDEKVNDTKESKVENPDSSTKKASGAAVVAGTAVAAGAAVASAVSPTTVGSGNPVTAATFSPPPSEQTKTTSSPLSTGSNSSPNASEMSEKQPTFSPTAQPDEKPKVEAKVDISGSGSNNGKDVYEMKVNNKGSNTKKILIVIILLIILLLLGGSYYYFNNKGTVVSPLWSGEESEGTEMTDQKSSNQFESPINGLLYSNSNAAKFKDRKPVAVMVNNTTVARPSSGLSKADIIYEAVAEGGITRLMPIFYSQSPDHVSSIRSARYYFVELASAYSPHYIHWGAAYVPDCQLSEEGCSHGQIETQPDVDAKARIIQLGVPNIDAGGYETDCNMDNDNCFVSRDPERVESMGKLHAGFVNFDQIFKVARTLRPEDSWNQYTPVTEWKFKDDAPKEERGNIGLSTPITYSYWETMPDFNVKWVYNPETNTYLRHQGGQKQVDMETGEDLEAKVVLVRFTNQESANDYKNHLRHDIVGTGDALVFQDGEVISATWTRTTHDERDIYTDQNGDQIEFVRGQIWVQLVPSENQVDYGQPTLKVIESEEAGIDDTEEVGNTE